VIHRAEITVKMSNYFLLGSVSRASTFAFYVQRPAIVSGRTNIE
jgi:hypothetical protein